MKLDLRTRESTKTHVTPTDGPSQAQLFPWECHVAPSVRPKSTRDACAPRLSEFSDLTTCEIDTACPAIDRN